MKVDFLILGGGIGGLTTAIALKHIGITATVAEATSIFKPVGAGIALAANAMKVYHQLGLYQKLTEVGYSIGEMQVLKYDGTLISHVNADKYKNGLTNLAISRPALHEVLLSKLDSKQIMTGKRSVKYTVENDLTTVWFDDNTSIQCKYLIVAEGIHSPIRKQLLPDSHTRYSGYTCWRGLTDNHEMKITETSETWGPQGRFGIVPIGNNKVYWFACKNAPANDLVMKGWKKKELQNNFKNYHKEIQNVLNHTLDESIIWNDIADLNPIHQFSFGKIVLLGDSAHATTPNLGQGACQAIEDAHVLASKLQQNANIEQAFKEFEQARMTRVHEIVNQSWKLGKIAQLENGFMAGLRNMALRMTPKRVYEKQISKIYTVEMPTLRKEIMLD